MPTTTFRPVATPVDESSAVVGAGSVHAALSDSSDSSYVQLLGGLGAAVICGLSGTAVPAGAAIVACTSACRAKADSIPDLGRLLGHNKDIVRGSVSLSTSPASLAIAPHLDSVPVLGFSGAGLVPTHYTVYELWLEILYATQPTVAVAAPTGTVTDRSAVDVVWGYTPGTDGGGQSRFQVRVFSDAQYAVGGFNPSTSAATWQDVNGLGSAVSATTAPLPNDTYRVYVRAAQTINGQPHWSEWDYEQFEIDVDTPDVLSFTATGQDDTARVRLVVTEDDTSDVLWDTLDVERSDDGGSTWVFVRGATAATPAGHMWIGYDYEAPNGTTVVYRARGAAIVDGFEVVGEWGQSNSTSWTSRDDWLKSIHDTRMSVVLHITSLPELGFARPQGVFYPLGSRLPVVLADVRQDAVGSIWFHTRSDAERLAVQALLESTPVLLLQTPESRGWGSRYIVPAGLIEQRVGPAGVQDRVWSFPFTVVARPVDDGAPVTLGVDWADILESGLTWQDALDQGLTWADLI